MEEALIAAGPLEASVGRLAPAGKEDQTHYDAIASNYNKRVACEWQPIDTAPRDGTHILCKERRDGYMAGNKQTPPYVAHWFDSGVCAAWVLSSGDTGQVLNPAWWMPLIEPPNDQASGARSVPLNAPVGRGED